MDKVSKEKRSDVMRAVKSKNTRPEMIVRKMLHRAGYRYRLHDASLPGKPDIIFPSRKSVIFIHGCFWHGHDCRAGRNRPASNVDYWEKKLARNCGRDQENQRQLERAGWKFLIVWECELKAIDGLRNTLREFLEPPAALS